MASSTVPSTITADRARQPITPPLSAIPEFTDHSYTSTAAPRTILSSVSPKRVKRRSSAEIFVSAPPRSYKKAKIVRSSSQPPAALRSRMARYRDSATPEIDDDGLPVRYTPTTGRISKAKKGLPVHYCQYGCGKVYTRAEHRKRHEANHRKDAMFRCTIPDCQKEFQRIDLFQRHLEKQWVPGTLQAQDSSAGTNCNLHRHGVDPERTRASSVTSSIGSSDPASLVEAQMAMPGMAQQMGLGLTTPPYSSTFPAYAMDQQHGQMGWPQQMQELGNSSSEAFPGAYSPSMRQTSQGQMVDSRSVRTMSAPPPTGVHPEFGSGSMAQLPNTPESSGWPSTPFWQQQQQQQQQQQSMSAAQPGFVGTYGPPDGPYMARSHSQMSMAMTLAEEQAQAAVAMAWSMPADLQAQAPDFTDIHTQQHQSYPLLAAQQGW